MSHAPTKVPVGVQVDEDELATQPCHVGKRGWQHSCVLRCPHGVQQW